jgi:hypothetical protein
MRFGIDHVETFEHESRADGCEQPRSIVCDHA